MVALENTVPITPDEFFSSQLPLSLQPAFEDKKATHPSAKATLSRITDIVPEVAIIDDDLASRCHDVLKEMPDVRECIPSGPVTLHNEASVALNCHSKLLVPVVNHLNMHLQDELDGDNLSTPSSTDNDFRKALRKHDYTVQIFYQHYYKDSVDKGASRIDHVIGLAASKSDKKIQQWCCTMEEFRHAVIEIDNESEDEGEATTDSQDSEADGSVKNVRLDLPKIALFIVEEKSAGALVKSAWRPGYKLRIQEGDMGAIAVERILPQIKGYSEDIHCNIVVLFDYVTTLLLRIDKACTRTLQGSRAKISVDSLTDSSMPRFFLFAIGIKQLSLMGAITQVASSLSESINDDEPQDGITSYRSATDSDDEYSDDEGYSSLG
ncbi:hypothetical protein CPB85DRAFT_1440895 [Mucidula mucida]|nr:hypothetical protein CPB85DRAFT_1440895 [Mucidula mucida]